MDLPDVSNRESNRSQRIESASLMSPDWNTGSLPLVPPGKPCALIYNICFSLSDLPHSV